MFGRLSSACTDLEARLSDFHLPEGALSAFSAAYLGSKLKDLRSTLRRNSFLLDLALGPILAGKDVSEICLVDYGAGVGDLALLAKACGVGTVINCDIYDVMSRDAHWIARAIGLESDQYVTADVDGLLKYLKLAGLHADCVVSFDCLEHIYDVWDFLDKIPNVSVGRLSMALASGANPKNPRIGRRLMALQRKMEQEGTIRKQGEDPRDTPSAYLGLRQKIIVESHPELKRDQVEELARRTRGRRIGDIIQATEQFVAIGVMPDGIDHPTNTCDPFTGNWCEQLLEPGDLAARLRARNCAVRVLSGYYGLGADGSWLKRILRRAANLAIRGSGPLGLYAAPFYCLHAVRAGDGER